MPIDIAIIPVAGYGTRLLPATKSQPKEMLPVARKPAVQYIVEELAMSGIRRVLFVTGSGKTAIENHFDVDNDLISYLRNTKREGLLSALEFERQDMEYFYTRQRQQLGLGDAVLCARPLLGAENVVVALGDSIIRSPHESNVLDRMMHLFEEKDADLVIAFQEVAEKDVVKYGVAQPKKGEDTGEFFKLEDVVEKPSIEDAPSRLAISARYIFKPKIFEALANLQPGKGQEVQLTDAIRQVIKEGGKSYGVRLAPGERRIDVGNFGSYFQAFVDFALEDEEYGPELKRYLKTRLESGGI